jgi:hypothetical protein
VRVPDHAVRVHHEGARQLGGIALSEAALTLRSGLPAQPGQPHGRSGHLVESASPKAEGPVGLPVRAAHAGEPHLSVPAEASGLVGAAQTDQHHAGPRFLESIPVVTQLRDVGTTERSPEVAQEDQ